MVQEERKIRVMIVEDNEELLTKMKRFLMERPGIEIVATERDGERAKDAALMVRPDVLLMDLVLPNADGFSIMAFLLAKKLTDVRVLLLSGISNDFAIQRALALGAYHYMMKPFSLEDLYEHIIQCGADRREGFMEYQEKRSEALNEEEALSMLLQDAFAMSPQLRGTEFLKTAVLIARHEADGRGLITKVIYPAVAQVHVATVNQVERSIRNAITCAWQRGTMRESGIFAKGRKPSNGEVITTLARQKIDGPAQK